jgi:hypothetical protein
MIRFETAPRWSDASLHRSCTCRALRSRCRFVVKLVSRSRQFAGGCCSRIKRIIAGAWYVGDFKSLPNASNNRLPNQSVFSATIAVGIKIPAKTPTLIKFKYSSTQTKRYSRAEVLHIARSRFHDFLCPLMTLTRLAVGLESLMLPKPRIVRPIRAGLRRSGIWFPR